jgi:hypothetical protein
MLVGLMGLLTVLVNAHARGPTLFNALKTAGWMTRQCAHHGDVLLFPDGSAPLGPLSDAMTGRSGLSPI